MEQGIQLSCRNLLRLQPLQCGAVTDLAHATVAHALFACQQWRPVSVCRRGTRRRTRAVEKIDLCFVVEMAEAPLFMLLLTRMNVEVLFLS